jgi:DNA-binding NarL/FixJ family response regulator
MTQTPTPFPRDGGPLRVLCVDDNAMVTMALARRLGAESALVWIGGINDGVDLVRRIEEARPDIVLMDVDMPDVDAFAVVEGLAKSSPAIRVIMLSGHVDPAYVDRAMDCGAWGYLSKNEDVSGLIADVHRVGRGEIAFSNEVQAARRSAGRVQLFT